LTTGFFPLGGKIPSDLGVGAAPWRRMSVNSDLCALRLARASAFDGRLVLDGKKAVIFVRFLSAEL
jgi:hypothetical protein